MLAAMKTDGRALNHPSHPGGVYRVFYDTAGSARDITSIDTTSEARRSTVSSVLGRSRALLYKPAFVNTRDLFETPR